MINAKIYRSSVQTKDSLIFLRRKGNYPYDWVDSIDTLAESSLPSKDVFYSRLKGEGITDDDYKHAKEV